MTALPRTWPRPRAEILRLNPDGTTPRGNPFGSPSIVGPRNRKASTGTRSRAICGSEHGNVGNDEINVIDAGAN